MSDIRIEIKDIFHSIGRLVYHWSWLETIIDLCILIIRDRVDGADILGEAPRTSLARKINFLRDAFKKLPIFEDKKDAYLDWINQVKGASEFRHDVIHSFHYKNSETSFGLSGARLLHGEEISIKMTEITYESLEEEWPKIKKFINSGHKIQDEIYHLTAKT